MVINVESSHTYGSVPKFLLEVKRVLKPGGYFLFADIRVADAATVLKQQLKSSGMEIVEEENISKNVILSIEKEEPIKQKRIQDNIPRWMQTIFKEFSGVTGSKAHTQLMSGNLVYYRYVLRKQ